MVCLNIVFIEEPLEFCFFGFRGSKLSYIFIKIIKDYKTTFNYGTRGTSFLLPQAMLRFSTALGLGPSSPCVSWELLKKQKQKNLTHLSQLFIKSI